ncbi:MAG TPA: hypothetical protein VIK61_11560, partial [Acidimicrobiia bacterium]
MSRPAVLPAVLEHRVERHRGDDPQHDAQLHRDTQRVPVDLQSIAVPDDEEVGHDEERQESRRDQQRAVAPETPQDTP